MSEVSPVTSQTLMDALFEINQPLLDLFYKDYCENAERLIPKVREDRKINQFDRFHKRFMISWGIKIEFGDDLPIKREDTRACYMLMLKIADLWFTFEHLIETASDVIPKDGNPRSKIDFYQETTLEELHFNCITANFNCLLYDSILCRKVWKQEIDTLLRYLSNKTHGGTRNCILDAVSLIQENKKLRTKHIFSILYGIRNIYVHEGVVAALGSRNYRVKKNLYLILYDALILYALALGDAYCRKKLMAV